MDISSKPVTVSLDSYLWGSRREDTQVTLTLKHENGILDALFCVREKELRRMVSEPNGKVWTDSCVELFIKAEDSSEYSNFEFSASGAFLACHGEGRKDRIRYSEEERKNIECSVRILENNNRQSRYEVHVRLNLLALGLVSEILSDDADEHLIGNVLTEDCCHSRQTAKSLPPCIFACILA